MTGKFVFLLGPNLLGSLLTWFKDSAPLETLTINNCKILYTPKDWDYSSSLSYALIFEIINYPYLFIAFFCRKMALIARWRQLRVERKPGVTFQKCSSCAFWLADKRCNATHPFRPPPPRPIWPLCLHSIRSSITLFFLFLCSFCCFSFIFSFFSFAQILRVFRNFNSWCLGGIYWYRPLAGGYSTVRPAPPTPFSLSLFLSNSYSIYLNQSPLLIPWPMPCLYKLLLYIGQYLHFGAVFENKLSWP